ncbi:MAG: GNAT family N-acetyltransferase [Chloroflexi bacterium]|nr:GNAT family N-acetyltransferase [Chloroflexota bacterium]
MLGSELLAGEKVRLVALTRGDASLVASWYADTEFMRLLDADVAFPKSEEDIGRMIDDARRQNTSFMFGVRRIADEQLVGIVELNDILWQHGVGWLTIAIAREFWGQGLGTEALRLLVQYAFMELNLRRLQLTVFDYNERAMAVYRKCGFQLEGTFREYMQRDGQRYDMHLMGLLRREWEERGRQ